MQRSKAYVLISLIVGLVIACVDPEEIDLPGRVDVIVVDGTITNLAEPQIIRLNRSKADPVTGRFSTLPITKAQVSVMKDSSVTFDCHETVDGSYQLPSDFRGQVGHAYQLRFTLSDGMQYASNQQVMQSVAAIASIHAEFNPNSLPANQFSGYRGGHDIFIDSQDPASQHNYYRWDWTLYERQYWCRTCQQGVYAPHKVLPHTYLNEYYFVAGNELFEDCFVPPTDNQDNGAPYVPKGYWYYDYQCRTTCWEILSSYTIDVFDDIYSDGGLIGRRKVAAIPFYQHAPCLVDVRQFSLTADAYRYYKLFAQQTQASGGLADTPPTVLAGNVHQVSDARNKVIGFFTASAVSLIHQWLDRKDALGTPLGALDPEGPHSNMGDDLFFALNRRRPVPESSPPYQGNRFPPNVRIWPNTDRPPTAICVPSDSRTPFKPVGWQD
jgi:hypothetical protein